MYFLNINKPKGITSFDVVRKLRKRLNIKKIGHSGTLDPMASGVMQVAVGDATKLLDFLESDKTYIATFKLGYISDTFDSEGKIEFVKKPCLNKDELINILNGFLGKIEQIPPKYSAIKLNGKKLCDIARKTPERQIEIPKREIEIYSIKLLNFNGYDEAVIEVSCKKGTYIRSLVNDIGLISGFGAYLVELIRTKAGNFDINNSNNIDDTALFEIDPINALNLNKIEINDIEYDKISYGNFIKNNSIYKDGYILLKFNKKLVCLAQISDNLIKPKKLFKGI